MKDFLILDVSILWESRFLFGIETLMMDPLRLSQVLYFPSLPLPPRLWSLSPFFILFFFSNTFIFGDEVRGS